MFYEKDLEFLQAASKSGATRHGGWWRAQDQERTAHAVARMRRQGLLTGAEDGRHLVLGRMGVRLLLAQGSVPALGSELTFRRSLASSRGRVIEASPREAIVVPSEPRDPEDGPIVYRLRRPHKKAPWKGTALTVGFFRGQPVWPRMEAYPGLLPAAWTAPFQTAPRTLARLREVVTKVVSIGGFGQVPILTVEEGAARTVLGPYRHLGHFRRNMARVLPDMVLANKSFSEEVHAYLADVLAHDAAEIAAVEYQAIVEQIGRLFLRRRPSHLNSAPLPTLVEVNQDFQNYLFPTEQLERAYAEALQTSEEQERVFAERRVSYRIKAREVG